MISRQRARLLIASMVTTFVIIRTSLYFSPDTDFNVGAYNVHHLFTGILLMTPCGIASVLCGSETRATGVATVGFGVGLSLALDEWVYLIVTDGSNASYLLPVSFIGGSLMVGAGCLYVLLLCWLGKQKTTDSLR